MYNYMNVYYGLIDLFTVFFNFLHGQVQENPSTPLNKIAKFESDMDIIYGWQFY